MRCLNFRLQTATCPIIVYLDCKVVFLLIINDGDSVKSYIEVNSLGQWHFGTIVEGTCWSPHILFPTIRTRLSTSSCMFLSTESSTNFSSRWPNVYISNSAVRSIGTDPSESVGYVLSEQAATQTLGYVVVDFNCLLQSFEFLNKEDGWEEFLL